VPLAAGEDEEVDADGVVGDAVLLVDSSEELPHATSTARVPSTAPIPTRERLIAMISPFGYALPLRPEQLGIRTHVDAAAGVQVRKRRHSE
jgi:hypothetical protein